MRLGIDPKVDYAFKWLFSSPRGLQLLIHLLNAILNLSPEDRIVEIQILNPFNEKTAWDEKLSILDIKARDQRDRRFNVEMQIVVPIGLRQRILYYWAKLYTEQLQAGQDYRELQPTISVCFVNGIVFPKTSEYRSAFRLIDPAENAVLTEDLSIHFFELPKFKLTTEQVTTPLEAWLYFLRHAEGLDPADLPGPLNTPEIRRAMEALMELVEIDLQKEIYEGRLKAQRDALTLTNALAEAETARAEAEAARAAEAAAAARAAEAAAARAAAEAARAGAEALEKGIVVGRIEFAQKLLRLEGTPRAALESMSMESLTALAAQLESELSE